MVEDTDPAFANSLRRVMITDVPTMAVQWIDVHENNSSLFDEVISHRMGLIPLKFNLKKFTFTDDCTCKGKGCPLCQAVFVVDKKGPCNVVSGDMKSSDKGVESIDPAIPIAQLLEGQSLKLEAVARLGTGLSHAKHQAANASYQYYPIIKAKASPADLKKALKACPKDLIEIKAGKASLKDPTKCDLCRSCMEDTEGVEVKGDESRIVFRVESISGLEPEDIVKKAAEILMQRGEEFKKKLAKV
jgi:DNA-directed RNA polymerase subunit D